MKNITAIGLEKHYFTESEKAILRFRTLHASLFKFRSGIHAVRIHNNDGFIIVLPYKGQQIWDAVFDDKSLTMKTGVDEPIQTDFFLDTYGCLMMHCGALRMGCPGPSDNHPLHGELPYAEYNSAELLAGEDDKGYYIGITGMYEHKPAFAPNYYARPLIKIYEDSSVLDISIEIHNLLHQPMELMYMCHINFRSDPGSSIVQSLGWTEEDMVLSTDHLHEQSKLSGEKLDLLEKLRHNPRMTQTFTPHDIYDPEINFFFRKPSTDKDGWAHFLQILEDGSSRYISYQPESLDHAVRWIWKNSDYEVLGLVLPSTADPEGYIKEKEKGNIKEIPGKSSVTFSVKSGYLNRKETDTMKAYIEKLQR